MERPLATRSALLAALAWAAAGGMAAAQNRGGGGGGAGRRDEATPAAAAGGAGTQRNEKAGFEVWLPPAWTVNIETSRIEAHNRPQTLFATIGPLADRDADLDEEDVIDFIDEELDDIKIGSDTTKKLNGLDARVIVGTATDEGDPVLFQATAIDVAAGSPVLIALVYGESVAMSGQAGAFEHIFRSLKPL